MKHSQEISDKLYAELQAVGLSKYSKHKHVIHVLSSVLDQDEIVKGVAIGRNANRWSCLLAATNVRILYIESDMVFHASDEFPFESVVTVQYRPTPLLDSVTLQTKRGPYAINMVATKAAEHFVDYVNKVLDGRIKLDVKTDAAKHLDTSRSEQTDESNTNPAQDTPIRITDKQAEFMQKHSVAVLSTTSRTREVFSAPVNYIYDNNQIRILARNNTSKVLNINYSPAISMTILDDTNGDSLTLQGYATQTDDPSQVTNVYQQIADIAAANPVQKTLWDNSNGQYVVIDISPTSANDQLS